MRHQIETNVAVPMRDGVRLRADVYRPDDGGSHPVILFRTPYNKAALSAEMLKPNDCLRGGYACVVQDTRGRFASEGDWGGIDWASEGTDTFDTVEWVAEQSWCDGNVGMAGPSYLGIVQWLGALEKPPHLKAIAPTSATSSELDRAETGGAFRLDQVLSWLAFMAVEWLQRRAAAGALPGQETVKKILAMAADPALVMDALPVSSNPWFDLDGFPIALQQIIDGEIATVPTVSAAEVAVPALCIGGFFDVYARSTVRQFQEVADGTDGSAEHRLILGPWQHAGILPPYQGGMNFGLSASGTLSKLPEKHLAFFDRHLKGGGESLPTVEYFVAVENVWRQSDSWPPAGTRPQTLYLESDGRAATQGGKLSERPGSGTTPDDFVSDPADPVPSYGGRVLYLGGLVAGPLDQSFLASRPDVAVYQSEPLGTDERVVGSPSLMLFASSSASDCDWFIKLLDVYPDGRQMLVADGNLRARFRNGLESPELLEPGRIYGFEIDLGPVAWLWKAGHRLGLHIQCSSFPHLDRNLQTGEGTGVGANGRPALQRIAHAEPHLSRLTFATLDGT